MSDMVELLRSLVRVNTENPPGNELKLAQVLADWLRRQGIDAAIDEFEPGRANLTAEARGSRPGRTLMLNTHMGVVPAGEGIRSAGSSCRPALPRRPSIAESWSAHARIFLICGNSLGERLPHPKSSSGGSEWHPSFPTVNTSAASSGCAKG
jgi:hypothetical protein